MKEMYSSVSPKGQVTIPAEIRRMLGVGPKDRVAFEVVHGHVRIKHAPATLDELYQSVPALGNPRSWEAMKAAVREEQATIVANEGLE